MESGKVILANNFLFYLNKWFFSTHTPSKGVYLGGNIRNTKPGISVSKSPAAHLEMLQNGRLKFFHNSFIAYLKINSLRSRVIDLGEILKDISLDYLVMNVTRLDEIFPNAKFKLNGYEVRVRRDRRKHGGGLMGFVRQAFIYKKLK